MKILINDRSCLLFVGKTMLKPGTNVLDDFDEEKNKAWIENGYVRVIDPEKATESEKRDAVKKCYCMDGLEALEKSFGKNYKKDIEQQKAILDKEEAEYRKEAAEYRANKGKKA